MCPHRSNLPLVCVHTEATCHWYVSTQKQPATGMCPHRSNLPLVCVHTEATCHWYVSTQKQPATGMCPHRSNLPLVCVHTEATCHWYVSTQNLGTLKLYEINLNISNKSYIYYGPKGGHNIITVSIDLSVMAGMSWWVSLEGYILQNGSADVSLHGTNQLNVQCRMLFLVKLCNDMYFPR